MKSIAIIVSALAATIVAAPAKEVRSSGFDLSGVNNLGFSNLNFNYLSNINSLDLNSLLLLSQGNNFDLSGFSSLFNSNSFDVNALLQLQQLEMLIQIQQLGLFNGFDLSSLAFSPLNFGLINNVGGLDLNQFIDGSLFPQIQAIAQQTGE